MASEFVRRQCKYIDIIFGTTNSPLGQNARDKLECRAFAHTPLGIASRVRCYFELLYGNIKCTHLKAYPSSLHLLDDDGIISAHGLAFRRLCFRLRDRRHADLANSSAVDSYAILCCDASRFPFSRKFYSHAWVPNTMPAAIGHVRYLPCKATQ